MIVDGIYVVRELLKSDKQVDKIIAEETNNKEIVALIDLAKAKGVALQIVDKKTLERIAKAIIFPKRRRQALPMPLTVSSATSIDVPFALAFLLLPRSAISAETSRETTRLSAL